MEKQRKIAYGIIEADNASELTERVTSMIGRGFLPQGGPFAIGTPGLVGPQGPKFYQAVMLVQEVEVPADDERLPGPTRLA